MGNYRITIDRLDFGADEPTITVIEFTTSYTVREDLAEWVHSEIDPDATVATVPYAEAAQFLGG